MCKQRLRNIDDTNYRSYSSIVLLNDICSIMNKYLRDQLLAKVNLDDIEHLLIGVYGCSYKPSLSYRIRYGGKYNGTLKTPM